MISTGTRLGPYEILSPIGAGGMGEVYRARDSRLGREVAIKVLPASFSNDPDRLRRFEQEAKAAGLLNHPNITAVYDIGSHEGAPYVVSELLEGETLRAELAGGRLSPRKAIDYALQIAHGLAAAHEKGIVHRDLKPENLFVAKGGRIKILDFGLAKLTRPETPGARQTEVPTATAGTEPGIVLGTVAYMSPEQVRGQEADVRSDLFAFGAVLYEMLAGRRAFRGDSTADTMSAILREDPPELSLADRDIPPALDRVLRHCLEKDRDNRFQSARDIAFALSEASGSAAATGTELLRPPAGKSKAFLAAAVILALAVAGILISRRASRETNAPRSIKRVAVLPFENLGSPEDDYFADGITDAVRGKLTSLPSIEVIARGSSISYKKTAKPQKVIAEELQAPWLLTATVRWQKSGGASRVQVNPELVEVRASGAPASRWQQPFDAALTDVFQVQSDIASRVAEALGVALGAEEEKELSRKPTQNLAAYQAFLRGEEVWRNGGGWSDLLRAIGFYEQAVALDPGFAQAWARLSLALSHHFDASPATELGERSRTAAEKAIALGPDSGEGYLALGEYRNWVLWDETGALEQLEKGQRLAPGNSELLNARAIVEGRLGRLKAAEEHIRQAERLDPRSIESKLGLSSHLQRLGRDAEAREVLDSALALAPTSIRVIQQKAVTFLNEGNLAAARAVIRAAPKEVSPTALIAYLATFGDLVWVLDEQQRELLLRLPPSAFESNEYRAMCLVQAYALKGDTANVRTYAEEARKDLEQNVRTTPHNAETHATFGLALAYLGRKDEAIWEGKHAVSLRPSAKNAFDGPYYQYMLARIYTLVGEPEKAIDNLEAPVKTRAYLSPGWLKIDPNFDPLRRNPRFQKLVASAK